MISNMPAQQKGFTLIETLLAVMLLTSAIAGPLTIAAQGLTSSLVAKDQITAFYLAQDAMEHVRFVRDSSCLAAGPQIVAGGCPSNVWLANLGPCISTDGSAECTVDSVQNTVCAYGQCGTVLNYNKDNNFFTYAAANGISVVPTPQQYIRKVRIVHDASGATPDEAVVTVTVSWSNVAGVTHPPITVRENIFRWQ